MFLSRFGVKNYKCLGDIDIPLTPIHVLIAQNDSGKTSLMEAIAALYGSLRRPVEELFPQPWQGRQLVWFGSPEPALEFRGPVASGAAETAILIPRMGSRMVFPSGSRIRAKHAMEQRWLIRKGRICGATRIRMTVFRSRPTCQYVSSL